MAALGVRSITHFRSRSGVNGLMKHTKRSLREALRSPRTSDKSQDKHLHRANPALGHRSLKPCPCHTHRSQPARNEATHNFLTIKLSFLLCPVILWSSVHPAVNISPICSIMAAAGEQELNLSRVVCLCRVSSLSQAYVSLSPTNQQGICSALLTFLESQHTLTGKESQQPGSTSKLGRDF